MTRQISLKAALAHGVVLGLSGFGLRWWKTNVQATLLAAFGFIVAFSLIAISALSVMMSIDFRVLPGHALLGLL